MHDIIISTLISSERERLFVGEARTEERQSFISLTRSLFSKLRSVRTDSVDTRSVHTTSVRGCASANCSCTPAH